MAAMLIAGFLAAAAALPLVASAPRLPDADPAIWVVNDDDTTIYLFGTFHALDGKSDWFNDEVMTAFRASDELVLEVVLPSKMAEVPMPAAVPAPKRLAVTASGSFFAATRAAVSAGKSKGLDVAKGADMVLRAAAEASGKKVSGLETMDEQFAMYQHMSTPQQDTGTTPAPPPRPSDASVSLVMSLMQSSWNKGQQGIFATLLKRMRANTPESYDRMFTRRNASWAQWISKRLEEPGTVFVAVGAGHLVGQDSVQAQLSHIGVKSARIN